MATRRKCRDILPLLFFLCFCGGMVYVCITVSAAAMKLSVRGQTSSEPQL